jgi:hypothetical protein
MRGLVNEEHPYHADETGHLYGYDPVTQQHLKVSPMGGLEGTPESPGQQYTDYLPERADRTKGGRDRSASRRVSRAPEENENWEEGASYAEYKGGKCTQCKSDNIDAAGHGTGEYDCYDCGATFHPKVRKLKSSVHEAGDMLDMSSHGGDSGSSASLRHRDDRANNRYTIQKIPDASFDGPHRAIVNHDDTELMSADGQHHWASLDEEGYR